MCALLASPSSLQDRTGVTALETPDVSIVIVNYNVREFLEQALSSVERASSGLTVETFVVDNNSVDGSVEMVRGRFPQVEVVANEENVGFARANNQAIRCAGGRYILILNPDTILQEDTLRTLVAFLDEHPSAGAAGCRILNADGTFAPESRRAFPTPAVALYRMLGLSRIFPRSRVFGRYNLTFLPADQVCEVEALSGSCMIVRREALLLSRDAAEKRRLERNGSGTAPDRGFELGDGAGLLDEAFFMYGEDLDWCFRIRQAGWQIFYTPATQIIHYKGESTRKGELRYVRLFYGAMLQFTEKHFSDRHSRLISAVIRGGILARAGVSVSGKVLNRLATPILDFSVAFVITVFAALVWSARTATPMPDPYLSVLAPASALAIVTAIAALGGYRRRSHRSPYPIRPLLAGVPIAFLVVATGLFFFPDLAFSRAAVLLSFAGAGTILLSWRLIVNRRHYGRRRGLLVGAAREAERLQSLLGRRLDPPLRLLGFVSDGDGIPRSVARLGGRRHLRDLVRLRQIDDVIFAADSLTNTEILGMMRSLRDLPVQFTILTEGQDRIISKASVHDLSTPLLEAEQLVAPVRSSYASRAFELLVGSGCVALHPLVRLLVRLRPESLRLRQIAAVTTRMPSVLAGRRALIGFDTTGPHPPQAWGLRPGLVSILDTLPERPAQIVDVHRAYWFYARNRSVALDIEILLRTLSRRA
jgi:O-antigen biosynthesis protein